MDYQFNFHEVFNLKFNLGDFVKWLLKFVLLGTLRGTSAFQKYISWLLLQNSLLHQSRHFRATQGLFSFPLCGKRTPAELQRVFPNKVAGMAFRPRNKAVKRGNDCVKRGNDCVKHSDSVRSGGWDRQTGQIKGPSGSASHPWQWPVADTQGKMIKSRYPKSDPKGMGQYDTEILLWDLKALQQP